MALAASGTDAGARGELLAALGDRVAWKFVMAGNRYSDCLLLPPASQAARPPTFVPPHYFPLPLPSPSRKKSGGCVT